MKFSHKRARISYLSTKQFNGTTVARSFWLRFKIISTEENPTPDVLTTKGLKSCTYHAAPFVTPPANSLLLAITGWFFAYSEARYLKVLSSGEIEYLVLHRPQWFSQESTNKTGSATRQTCGWVKRHREKNLHINVAGTTIDCMKICPLSSGKKHQHKQKYLEGSWVPS